MARYLRSSSILVWLVALICSLRPSSAIPIDSGEVSKKFGPTSEEIDSLRQAKVLNFPKLLVVPPNPLSLNPYHPIGLKKNQDSISKDELQGRIFFTTSEQRPLDRIADIINSWTVDIRPDLRPAQIIDGGLRDIAQAIRNN